jgi:hypothetical protein
MNPPTNRANQEIEYRRASGTYCPPESPMRFTIIVLASMATGLLLTLLPSCDTHTQACASSQQHGVRAVCR